MFTQFRFAIPVFLVGLASACSTSLPLFGSSSSRLPEARCHAAGAQAQLGKTLDDETSENARAEAGALRARVVRYGGIATTMVDSDPQRLTIEVDEAGRIRRMRCG